MQNGTPDLKQGGAISESPMSMRCAWNARCTPDALAMGTADRSPPLRVHVGTLIANDRNIHLIDDF